MQRSIVLFFILKPTRCTNFTNLFWYETLHVSDSSSVHHQEFIHCTGPGWNSVPSWSCSKAVYELVWHIPLLNVQWIKSWWWTEELFETCRVSCQNKFVKLVHLVGFIINKFVTMHSHMKVKKKRVMFSCESDNETWGSRILWEFLDCGRTGPVTFPRTTVSHKVRQLRSINY